GAIREMVNAFHAVRCVGEIDREDLVRAILHREQLGTTGFGDIGVAFPEARHPAVARVFGTIALSHGGVEVDAMGGGLVHMLCLVVSPPDRPADFLRAEEMLSWLLALDDFRDLLRRAATRAEIMRLMAEADRESLWEAGRVRLHDSRHPA